jgi:squalene-hopene/tetraprenyl-beta-curcumene cyclase
MNQHPLDRRAFVIRGLAGAAGLAAIASASRASTPRDGDDASRTVAKAVEFLTSKQDAASGGWCVSDKAPNFPAVTALVLSGMLESGAVKSSDPVVASGVKYLLSAQQEDGGIHFGITPSYNTAISLATLTKVRELPGVDKACERALAFLRALQHSDEAAGVIGGADAAKGVAKDHPFHGGVGYGKHGRPDLSNTAFFVDALHAAGVDGNDPAMKRVVIFLQRVQMLEKTGETTVNDMPYAKGSRQGGFIYATSENKDKVGSGQSFAGVVDESLSDGTVASRLRCYGSMTYAGFKSYLYAGLRKDDPRVLAAFEWISKHYTLDENPGVGNDGLYYYYLVFAKAMAASGVAAVGERDWRRDLQAKLASLQQQDGSFKVVDSRWMEDNQVLTAAYSLGAIAKTL